MNVYESLTDKNIVFKVNERFYELVYDHKWLSNFFKQTDQEFITQQQTDFIIGAIGGPKNYSGRMVRDAHPHMFITEELFELRQELLIQAFEDVNAPDELKEAWLKIDDAFKNVIIKKDISECKKRFFTDDIIDYPNPNFKKSA